MVSPSFVKPSAPSVRLLRFLRSQSDNICFFRPNVARFSKPDPRARSGYHGVSSFQENRLGCEWLDSQSVRCPATLEASFLPSFLQLRPRKPGTPLRSSTSLREKGITRGPTGQQTQAFSLTPKRTRNLLLRLFGFQRPTGQQSRLNPDDLPPSGAFEDGLEGNPFTAGRKLALKASNEPRLRCTEFDDNGNVTLVSEEFKKSELIAKVSFFRQHRFSLGLD